MKNWDRALTVLPPMKDSLPPPTSSFSSADFFWLSQIIASNGNNIDLNKFLFLFSSWLIYWIEWEQFLFEDLFT